MAAAPTPKNPNSLALAVLRIAVGVLFLIFASTKFLEHSSDATLSLASLRNKAKSA